METTRMKIEYRKQVDSETAPWQLLTNMDELLWNGVYALRVAHDDGSHNLPFRFENDETVTIVVKDHAHEGMLENGRTVVQTITRVDRTTGNVYVYTRTRYNAGGTHAWSYWALAGEGNVALETPKASKSSLGSVIVGDGLAVDADGKVSVAAGSIGEEQLAAEVTSKIASMRKTLQHAGSFAVNDGIILRVGALVENSTPYSGTNYRAYTDRILSNGERLIVNEGYSISSYKIFDGEQEIAFAGNQQNDSHLLEENGRYYQFEFKKDDATAFANSELPVVIKYFQRNPMAWCAGSHIDNYIAPGTYNIHGDRTNLADGLPIYNTGSFSARLTVLAAHNCVTQILTLLNVGGGDGNVYTRTRQGSNWGTWSKLQQNVEVGQTTSLDAYIDNGIYSGVYTASATPFETFVMVVINNYAVAAATGTARNITQLKYAVDTNGNFSCHVRTGQGADTVEWGQWRDLDTVSTARIEDGAVTAQKLSNDVREKVNNPLRPLYIAAGAEYNDSGVDVAKTAPWGEIVTHKAGHYYLNGLGDITEEQMMTIYNAGTYKGTINYYAGYNDIRTFLPAKMSGMEGYGAFQIRGLVADCKNIEVVRFSSERNLTEQYGISIDSSDISNAFCNCNKLKYIQGIALKANSIVTNTFAGCRELVWIKLFKLAVNLSLAASSKISKESIRFVIQKSKPTSAITITLHPEAYARLADDAEIVAALEAQPLVSLVSA